MNKNQAYKKLYDAVQLIENALMCYCEDSISEDVKEQERINVAWNRIVKEIYPQ